MRKCILHTTFFILVTGELFAQSGLTVSVKTYQYECNLAAAAAKVQGGLPPYSYQWSNGAIGDTISSLPAATYTVHVTDSDSPPKEEIAVFTIDASSCKVTFNNRFTPNGDGHNDTWGIGGNIKEYPDFLLQVFDRWGQLVHQQRNEYIPWDGTHLGVKVPDATYYYIFFYKDGKNKEFEKGSITIVR